MKQVLINAAFLLGLVMIAVGVGLKDLAAGLVVGGILLAGVAWQEDRAAAAKATKDVA